jgi:hypothetical protein
LTDREANNILYNQAKFARIPRSFSPPQYHYHHPAFEKYFRATLISTALSESIGIYGLVLFLLGKDWSSLYFLIIVSAIAMYYFRPKKQELLDLATEMTVKQFQNNLTPSKGQR